jgi:hypothetical protein
VISSETYYRNHRWWFAVNEVGKRGQWIDTVVRRLARNGKDAKKQAACAVEYFKRQKKHKSKNKEGASQ